MYTFAIDLEENLSMVVFFCNELTHTLNEFENCGREAEAKRLLNIPRILMQMIIQIEKTTAT